MRKVVVGTALALASTLAAAQGYGYGPGMMGQGMMGQGQGMMGQGMTGQGMAGGMFAALNLSDEQRAKVLAIQEEHRKKNWATMGEVRAEQFKLRSMYGTDSLDANNVVEQQKKVDALRQLAPWWLSDEPE